MSECIQYPLKNSSIKPTAMDPAQLKKHWNLYNSTIVINANSGCLEQIEAFVTNHKSLVSKDLLKIISESKKPLIKNGLLTIISSCFDVDKEGTIIKDGIIGILVILVEISKKLKDDIFFDEWKKETDEIASSKKDSELARAHLFFSELDLLMLSMYKYTLTKFFNKDALKGINESLKRKVGRLTRFLSQFQEFSEKAEFAKNDVHFERIEKFVSKQTSDVKNSSIKKGLEKIKERSDAKTNFIAVLIKISMKLEDTAVFFNEWKKETDKTAVDKKDPNLARARLFLRELQRIVQGSFSGSTLKETNESFERKTHRLTQYLLEFVEFSESMKPAKDALLSYKTIV